MTEFVFGKITLKKFKHKCWNVSNSSVLFTFKPDQKHQAMSDRLHGSLVRVIITRKLFFTLVKVNYSFCFSVLALGM